MPIQTIKTLSMPPEVLEQGQALADKYTDGNFSKLVRLLIESAVHDDELPAFVASRVELAEEG